jgi:hypothetical protein
VKTPHHQKVHVQASKNLLNDEGVYEGKGLDALEKNCFW